MSLNHRTRLALVSAATTGLVLLALFAAIVLLARRDAIGDRRTELDAVMRSFMPPDDPSFDLAEFHSAHPELSAAVYAPDGRRVGVAGRKPPPHLLGFHERDDRLVLGRPFRGQDVTLSLDVRETERGLKTLTAALVAAWFPLTLLIGAIAWASAQSVFRPLERLSAQALAMGGTDLAERLVTPDSAEFGAFARDLNQMLDRVEETVRRGERFSTDAAHELRTPLAIMRTRLETALLQPRSQAQYEATLRRSVEEIGRLTATTEALLRSARGVVAVAGPLALVPEVREIEEAWRERFRERRVALQSQLEEAWSLVTPEETRMVLDNLLDNALRFSPEGSRVLIRLRSTDVVELSVADQGPGFPPELGERAFDRLARADDSRNRASGGAGIGLSVVRRIVESRGGEARIEGGTEGGATVVVRLPAATGSS